MKRNTFYFTDYSPTTSQSIASQIYYLPQELWNKIFSDLDSLEMANFPLVSKWAYNLFWQSLSFLKFRENTTHGFLELVFSKCNPITIQTIVAITDSFDDRSCKIIAQRLVNLDTLLLRNCIITDEGIGYLASLKNLSYMDISARPLHPITSESLKWLSTMESLCEIRITGLEVNGPVLSNFKKSTNLMSLSLDTSVYSITIDDSEISHLVSLTKLHSLSLFSCSGSGNSTGFSALTCLSNLSFLGLAHQNFSDEHCDIICHLTSLQKLALISSALRDEGVIKLSSRLTQLTTFNICGNITDNGIYSLKTLKLKEVDITSVTIGNDSLKYLSEIPSLNKLYLRMSSSISDVGLCFLSSIPLSHLRLHCLDDITNVGLIQLVQNTPSLRELNIINCYQITSDIKSLAHEDLFIKIQTNDKKETEG